MGEEKSYTVNESPKIDDESNANVTEFVNVHEVMYKNEKVVINSEKKAKSKGSSVILASMNLTNCIVGSGIITLSLTIKDSGIGVGIILLSISAIACGWSLLALAMCAEKTKTTTYTEMVRKHLGKGAYIIMNICIIVFSIIGVVAYAITIADNLTIFFSAFTPNTPQLQIRAVVLVVPFYAIIFPLSCFKKISFLDKFSSASIVLVFFYIAVILYKTASLPVQTITYPGIFSFSKSNAIKALPVFAFAFSVHENGINLYRSIRNTSIKKYKQVKSISLLLSMFFYIIVALAGYYSFGGFPFGNVFNNYCNDDILLNVTRIIFSITLMLTIPLQLFPPREVVVNEILGKYKDQKWIPYLVSFLIISVAFIVGSTVTTLSAVVEIGSAISNVPIVYIIPAFCALKLYGKPYYPNTFKKFFAYAILLFGFLMLVAGPVFTILDIIESSDDVPIVKYFCNENLVLRN